MRSCHQTFMQLLHLRWPALVRLTRDLPLLPGRAQRGVQPFPQRLQPLLVILPDHVDLGIVGDRPQRDMRHAFINEALADVAVAERFRGRLAFDLGLLQLPGAAVGEQVVGIAGAHDADARQRQGHARSVNRDPAPAPLFGNVGRRAGAAGGVEHEVAGVGSHEDAAPYDLSKRLHNIEFFVAKSADSSIKPGRPDRIVGCITKIPNVSRSIAKPDYSSSLF